MGRAGIRELEQNASAVVSAAAAGRTVIITAQGREVAQLSPISAGVQIDLGASVGDSASWRAGRSRLGVRARVCHGRVFEDEEQIDEDDRAVRSTDEVLPMLLEPVRARSGPRRRQRIDAAEQDLRRCLEAHADRLLTDPELAILPFEEAFQPDGAVARVASPDILLLALPFFLREPEWHGADREDRRVRIRMSDVLAHAIPHLPELQGYSVGAAVWSVEYALDDARHELRVERQQRR